MDEGDEGDGGGSARRTGRMLVEVSALQNQTVFLLYTAGATRHMEAQTLVGVLPAARLLLGPARTDHSLSLPTCLNSEPRTSGPKNGY